MHSGYPGDPSPQVSRQDFLLLGGAGLAGAVLLGTGGQVLAQTQSSLRSQVRAAASEYGVPAELLLAIGYVNTLWEMPPPTASPYERGELHGRGTYGFMQLQENPTMNTLGRAAELTGLTEQQLKEERAANIRGGAAVLADIAGSPKPAGLNEWQEAVAGYGDSDLYAHDVFVALEEGASLTISTGERVSLDPQEVEVPQLFVTSRARRGDYPRAVWRPANRGNYSPRYNRERDINIKKIVIHVAQGSYSGTVNWFQNSAASSSAHYTVGRRGQVAQSVRNEDVAWHAGWWATNKKSIGIEHEGFISNPRAFSKKMYNASARLTAWCCKKHKIRVTRRNIIGHHEVPGCRGRGGGASCHTDPGRHWNWGRYIRLVKKHRRRL